MATTYGGTTDDFVYATGAGGVMRAASATLYLWEAESGGSQVTDLLLAGAPASTIPVASGQVPTFVDPNDLPELWASAGASGVRIRMLPAITDEVVAEFVNDPASTTRARLDATYASWADLPGINLARLGAKFDRRAVALTTEAASTTLTHGGTLTAADNGKVVFIPGAGPTGTPYYGALIASISGVTATTASLSTAATAAVTGAASYVGTNNDAAWTAAFDLVTDAGGGTIVLPEGHGLHATQKSPPDNMRIIGAGRDLTFIHPVGAVNGFHRRSEIGSPDIVRNVHFSQFTVDGDMQTNGDGAGAKGFNLSYVNGGTFTDVIVQNTAGSGFGNDVQVDTHYTRCLAINCGRIGDTSSPGHSGFGFGSGAYATENVTVVDCISRGNMRHGLFLEDQPVSGVEGPLAAGVQVIGGRFEGNGLTGISDQSGRGMLVLGAHLVGNLGKGFNITTTAAIDMVGYDGMVANCIITGNTGEGVELDWSHTPSLAAYGRYRIFNNLIAENGSHGVNARAATGYTIPEVEIRGNTIRGNTKNGVRVAGGTFTRARIVGNTCIDNGQGSDGAGGGLTGADRGGVSIQTVFTDSEISGNYCTDSRSSGKSQAFGINFSTAAPAGTATGATVVMNNDVAGNGTAGIAGIGTQFASPASARGNAGTGTGTINTKTGSSPLAHTAGAQPEQHFIAGGTVTQVAVAGSNLLASGSVSAITEVTIQPYETLTVTYSAAPTWKYRTLGPES